MTQLEKLEEINQFIISMSKQLRDAEVVVKLVAAWTRTTDEEKRLMDKEVILTIINQDAKLANSYLAKYKGEVK
jgi:hypothetical protein